MCRTAFDLGITHFDLANNYGPPPGSAELAFGRILKDEFAGLRDELIISTKAGHSMWDGPYGDWGSSKHLIASCDQSLKRLGLAYVDIYSHRPDPVTPIEETCAALDHIVRSARALYAGISACDSQRSIAALQIFKQLGTPCIISQPRYSMLDRWIEEDGLLPQLEKLGMGAIGYSPLAQGMLTSKYLNGVPEDSRAAGGRFLKSEFIRPSIIESIRSLNDVATARGQSLAQMALA